MTATMRKAIVMLLGMMLTTTVSAQSSTSLLNSYVQQRFDELLPGYAQSHSLRRSAKDGLTGNNLLAYDYLKGIIQQVAAGSVESTVFEIPLNEIMTKTKWTAQELGVGSTFPDNKPSQDLVRETFQSCVDFSIVIGALLDDLPFECYWFDKTKGWGWSYGYSYNSKEFTFTKLSLTMYIAQEYAVQSGSQYNPTQFNTSMLAAISVAVENAQSIVESSTGTLLERLVGYKEKICELTSTTRLR